MDEALADLGKYHSRVASKNCYMSVSCFILQGGVFSLYEALDVRIRNTQSHIWYLSMAFVEKLIQQCDLSMLGSPAKPTLTTHHEIPTFEVASCSLTLMACLHQSFCNFGMSSSRLTESAGDEQLSSCFPRLSRMSLERYHHYAQCFQAKPFVV